MATMQEQLDRALAEAEEAAAAVRTRAGLEALKARLVGPNGSLTAVSKAMGALPKEERPEAGKRVNAARQRAEALLADLLARVEEAELAAALGPAPDPTLPSPDVPSGVLHPLTRTRERVLATFRKLGFVVAEGPEIETEWHCFDALNTPADHPAREPPLRIVAPGRCFRRDAVDATHSANFHQVEGLWVDRSVTLADLRGVLDFFVRETFGPDVETRLRPSFFPFTEPSFEMDIRSPDLGRLSGRWLEVLGCGLVDPKVLVACELDPAEWSGLAFGLGLERIAMLVHGIDDIRHLYANDLRFLRQLA
jgi:phenylalanyl-tRNA synthetase alpha chain